MSVIKRLYPYFCFEKKRMIYAFFVSIVITAVNLSRPLILRSIIDNSVSGGNADNIWNAVIIYACCLVMGGILTYFQVYNITSMGINIVNSMKKRVFSHILTQGMEFFDKNHPGTLMSRTESDCETLKTLFTNASFTVLSSLLMLIGILSIMIYEAFEFGIIMSLCAIGVMCFFYWYADYIRKIWTEVRKKNSELSAYITEYIKGTQVLQLYLRHEKIIERLKAHNMYKFKFMKKVIFANELTFWPIFGFFTDTLALMAIFYFGISRIFEGRMTLGTMIMFSEMIRQFVEPLGHLIYITSQLQSAVAAAGRIFGILDNSTKVEDTKNYELISDDHSIIFENVCFSYNSEKVLTDFDLFIKKGEKLAIAGASGSGKTTILNLLMRFYDVDSGTIRFGNKNVKDISLEKYRSLIGLVLQDVHLFPGSLMDNLKAFRKDISDEKVIDAAIRLDVYDIIKNLSNGFYTEVSEDGKNFSEGQKQIFSFLRAYIKDPEILILDEATSSIDVITERTLQKALERLMHGRTVIMVAHRLKTIEEADRIIVMDKGRIIECGNHFELIEQNGVYRTMHNIQNSDMKRSA